MLREKVNLKDTAGTTPNLGRISLAFFLSIPSVNQVVGIVVAQVSGQDDMCTGANGISSSGNLNEDGVVDVYDLGLLKRLILSKK